MGDCFVLIGDQMVKKKQKFTVELFWCVTEDRDANGKRKAHGPYLSFSLADAFKDGVEYVNDSAISVIGVCLAKTAWEALAHAKHWKQ